MSGPGGGPSGRVGVFGGSFDPPHIGHLIVAEALLEALFLQQVLFVPARHSPLKPVAPSAPPDVRLRMVRAAVRPNARFAIDAIEVERTGVSYTVDTLRVLSRRHPGTRFVLGLGADQWASFGRWRGSGEIAALAEIAVVTRGGGRPGADGAGSADVPHLPFTAVRIPRVDVSSTLIRRRIREGRSVRYLVPDGVRRIIEAEGLYLMDGPSGEGAVSTEP